MAGRDVASRDVAGQPVPGASDFSIYGDTGPHTGDVPKRNEIEMIPGAMRQFGG